MVTVVGHSATIAERLKLTFADSQTAAIRQALACKVLVITGGPGVGKTTIVKAKEVYNGDIGFVEDVDSDAGELTARFDGRLATYSFDDRSSLRGDHPQESGVGISGRGDSAAHAALCDVAAELVVHGCHPW